MYTLNILTSIDIAFYIIIVLAVLFGFLRGFKKSIYNFIVMAIFYLVFFLTLNFMVDRLWSMNLGFLGNVLSNVDASLSSFTSFESDYQAVIQALFNNSFDFSQPEMDLLAIGVIRFALKITWSIVYFTVILIIYKIITNILRMIFIKTKKGKSRNRGLGAAVGVLNGAMAVFITLIVMGGTMSFLESVSLLLPEDEAQPLSSLTFEPRTNIFELNYSLVPENNTLELAATSDPLISQENKALLNETVEKYQKNIIVKIANGIKVNSSYNEDEKVPLHIDLFDQVIMFEYGEKSISLRHEVSIFSKAYKVFQSSDYGTSNKITDIKGEDIRLIFSHLESSVLLPTALPIGIKYYSNASDITLSVSDDDLYAYDYSEEIKRLSSIIAGVFDILNEQTVSIDANGNEVLIDGLWVKDIFTDVSESMVVILATEAILVPMLDESEEGLGSIIEVAEDISWQTEYKAIGDILAELIDADVSIKDIESADINFFLEAFSKINVSTVVDSSIISGAMINILSGESDMEGIDVLIVPSDVVWRSTDLVAVGELEYLLLAVQKLVVEMPSFDFEALDVSVLTDIDDLTLATILDSYIIRATISEEITAFEIGIYELVIPDSTKENGYFTKTALENLLLSFKVVSDDLDGFSLNTLYGLSDPELATLLNSNIIQASISDIILDQALLTPDTNQLALVVPAAFREDIIVNNLTHEQIERSELEALIKGLKELGLTDFDGGISASDITTDLDYKNIILKSGSLHISIDNIIKSNPNISIPDLATSALYGVSNLTTDDAIINLIKAVDALSATDSLTSVNFNFNSIRTLTPSERDIVLTSMIVRNIITPEAEAAEQLLIGFDFNASDYENNNTALFLTKSGIERLITAMP